MEAGKLAARPESAAAAALVRFDLFFFRRPAAARTLAGWHPIIIFVRR